MECCETAYSYDSPGSVDTALENIIRLPINGSGGGETPGMYMKDFPVQQAVDTDAPFQEAPQPEPLPMVELIRSEPTDRMLTTIAPDSECVCPSAIKGYIPWILGLGALYLVLKKKPVR